MKTSDPTHLIHLLEQQAERTPNHPALSWLTDERRHDLTWAEYRHQVWAVASRFVEMGVQQGETVAILAPNIVEHYVADLAAVLCGAATVSLYPTLVDEQLAHILTDARPVVVITNDTATADRLGRAMPRDSESHFVCVHGAREVSGDSHVSWADVLADGLEGLEANEAELTRRLATTTGSEVATYVYTSGTTGMPKGVSLTHANLLFEIEASDRMGFFAGGYPRVVSYLPLAHIAERLWSLYFPLRTGGNVLLCPDQDQLLTCMRLQRPSFFMGVPRVWEKLRDAAMMILSTEPYASRADEVAKDRAILAQAWTQSQDGSLGSDDQVQALKAKEGILYDLRRDLGLNWTIVPASGAAALPEDLRDFWRSIGVDLAQAYGLSETTGVAVWERIEGARRGTVGFAVPGCEVTIAKDGEILVRTPGNTPGYRNTNREEAGLFVDGWLATGDVGHLDESGRLYVTDRKKELIVNAAGKNISPTAIEDKVSGRGLINQVVAVGDGRPYVTGLMSVNEVALTSFAREQGLEGEVSDLVSHPAVIKEAQRIVDEANDRLSRPEQIKRFRLVADQWSVETGELTPTLKLRRRAILTRYSAVIDDLYGQPRDGAS